MKKLKILLLGVLFMGYSGVDHAQVLENKLVASDREAGDHLGHHGAICIDGNFAVAGAHYADNVPPPSAAMSNSGAAYIFMWRDDLCSWVQTDIITAESAPGTPDENAGDEFGRSVSISGNTVVIGAPRRDMTVANSGVVYVYTLSPAGIATFSQRLYPFNNFDMTDFDAGGNFGVSVKINNDLIIVGADNEDQDGDGAAPLINAGAAYIYRYNVGPGFLFETKIVAPDRAALDRFGNDVSIMGQFAIVGAEDEDEDEFMTDPLANAGSAYVFQYTGPEWTFFQKLDAPSRLASDRFGSSVDIGNGIIVIGASGEDDDELDGGPSFNNAGAAYIFNLGSTFSFSQKIVAADRQIGDNFGNDLSLDGSRLVVGAPGQDLDENGLPPIINSAGAAYQFELSGSWTQTQKFVATVRDASDLYGEAVGTAGNRVIVAATGEDHDEDDAGPLVNFAGSCYVYGLEALPVIYAVTASPNPSCSESDVVLTVDGDLFDGTEWVWHMGPCGPGSIIGIGESITVSPTETTTYCVRGHGCFDPESSMCQCIEVVVNDGYWHQDTDMGARDLGNDVAVDSEGSVYVTGQYYDETNFPGGGNTPVYITDGSPSASVQSYVTKYDNCGNLMWVARSTYVAGSGDNAGTSIVIDESGSSAHVYVAGNFSNAITFQGGIGDLGGGGASASVSGSGSRGYVVRLNANDGMVDYIDNISIGATTTATAITINEVAGRLYVGGEYAMASPDYTVYVRSYDPTGLTIGTPNWQIQDAVNFEPKKRLNDLDFDENTGAIWMIGNYKGTLALNYGASAISSSGANDAFVARYIEGGWMPLSPLVRTGNIMGEMTGEGIAVSETFGAYLTGGYMGNSAGVFGTPQILPGASVNYAYFVALDNSMNPMWSDAGVAGPFAKGHAVVQKGDRAYFTGEYGDFNLDFNGLGTLPYDAFGCSVGTKHTFAVSYNRIGFTTINWINGTTDPSACSASHVPGGIAADDNQHAFIAGSYNGEMGYLSGVPESGNLVSAGQSNMFAMRVDLASASGEFKSILDDLTKEKDENLTNSGFSLSPNPAENSTIVELDNFNSEADYELKIVDLKGKFVFEGIIQSKQAILDLSNLDMGMYFVVVKEGNQSPKTERLVVK